MSTDPLLQLLRLKARISHQELADLLSMTPEAVTSQIEQWEEDGTILGWAANRIRRRSRYETLPMPVTELVFLPDKSDILTVDAEGRVELWDSHSLQAIE